MSLRPPTQGTPSTATFESRISAVESRVVDAAAIGAVPGLGTINAAVAAYLTANPIDATGKKGGITIEFAGQSGDLPYNLAAGDLTIPLGVAIVGKGVHPATRFKATDATSRIVIRTRGGVSGNFTVDANSLATEPFYTDGVDRTFLPVDVINSAGSGIVLENAQNCLFMHPAAYDIVGNGIEFRNGASSNVLVLPNVSGVTGYFVKQYQTVAQGAAYPNGLSGTILAGSPNGNRLISGVLERHGTAVGGGTVGVGSGGVYCRGGTLYLDGPILGLSNATSGNPAGVEMDWDGVSSTSKVYADNLVINGTTVRSVGVRITDTTSHCSFHYRSGTMQALLRGWELADSATVYSWLRDADYNSVTNRFVNNGAGTKTEDALVRGPTLSSPVDMQRPAAGNTIRTSKVTGDTGWRVLERADGNRRVGVGTSFTETALIGLPLFGAGTPEASVTAPVGSLYMRTDGGAATTLYVKESGTGSTGWIAK